MKLEILSPTLILSYALHRGKKKKTQQKTLYIYQKVQDWGARHLSLSIVLSLKLTS